MLAFLVVGLSCPSASGVRMYEVLAPVFAISSASWLLSMVVMPVLPLHLLTILGLQRIEFGSGQVAYLAIVLRVRR